MYFDLNKNFLLNYPFYEEIKFLELSSNGQTIAKLINLNDFKEAYKLNDLNTIKFIYYHRKLIHNIIYEKENNIILNDENQSEFLSFYYYLNLLINENKDIVNYAYSNNYIKAINKRQRQDNYGIYKKLIFSKIILSLIENYKGLDNCELNEEIKAIENDNIKIIENNYKTLNELDLYLNKDDIITRNIDELYSEIIIAIIKNNKLMDDQNILNIITQLDFESINFDNNYIILNSIENINKEYSISKEEDLFDNKKINFYFILFKYILKSSIFIYQINFLSKIKLFIIKLIRTKSLIFSCLKMKNLEKNMKQRLDYILEIIIDSSYYIKKIDELKHINIEEFKLDEIIIKCDENINNVNKDKLDIDKNFDKNYFNESRNVLATSTKKDSLQKSVSKENTKRKKKKKKKYRNKNIKSDKEESEIILNTIKKSNIITIESHTEVKNVSEEQISEEKYNILKYNEIIGTHRDKEKKNDINTADFILEINKYFISGGTNNISYIYDQNFLKKKIEIKQKDWIYNIYENDNINDKITLFICTQNYLYNYKFSEGCNNEPELIKLNTQNEKFLFTIKVNNVETYICYETSVKSICDISNRIAKNVFEIFKDKSMKSAIKVFDLLIFKSNKVVSKGEDKLTFFNYKTKKEIIYDIKDYSFVYSSNGLATISINNNKEILLCACKKYLKHQKNGILLVNIEKNNNNEYKYSHQFYNTYNYEVFCFCPIFIIEKKDILTNGGTKKKTDYFLVGGYQTNINKGKIKLYKISYEDNLSDNKIEFIEDINILDKSKKFKGFKGPISYITQSKNDGKILITCWDGNVYLFNPPNIECYLKYDEMIKNTFVL